MKPLILAILLASSPVHAADLSDSFRKPPPPLEIAPNSLGPGVNTDQFGRIHEYRHSDGTPLSPPDAHTVRRDLYGLGVHSDSAGNPVYDAE